jgi:hypothetical protein
VSPKYPSADHVLRRRERIEASPRLAPFRDRRRRARLLLAVEYGASKREKRENGASALDNAAETLKEVREAWDEWKQGGYRYDLEDIARRITAIEREARTPQGHVDRRPKLWRQARRRILDFQKKHGDRWEAVFDEEEERYQDTLADAYDLLFS